MTAQGLMSGKERFFDKQDQKRLDEDWLTGFDNRDRLAFLAEQIREVNEQLVPAKLALDAAQGDVGQLRVKLRCCNASKSCSSTILIGRAPSVSCSRCVLSWTP